jgi:hypothetical protein
MRKVLIGAFAVAAVGGAYYLGATSNAPPPAPAVEQTAAAFSPVVDNLIVPTGLTIPEKLPELKIDEPARVLVGEVKVPTDLLRVEPPPAQPDIVVPKLK